VQLSKVPGIGDIPILGNLFRSRTISRSNSELLVLVTPHIVDPAKLNTPSATGPVPPVKFLENGKFDKDLPNKSTPAATNNKDSSEPAPTSK